MYEQCEVDVIDTGKATQRLIDNKDFQKVILDGFMDDMALEIGKSFYGSSEQIDTLKSITLLSNYLTQKIDDAKNIINSNKGN